MHHGHAHHHSRRVITAKYWAVGGPPESGTDDSGNRFGPTTAGQFVINRCTQHVSHSRYALSKIAWGTRLRDTGTRVLARVHGRWQSVEAITGMSRVDLAAYYESLYGKSGLPATWLFNDFGHITCYYFKDLNHDGRLDGKEHIRGDMMHTTPYNEAEQTLGKRVQLQYSHGCIHIRPTDIDDMIKRRYLAHGNLLVVHKPGARPAYTPPVPAAAPFEVHFWPSANNIFVLGWIRK